MPHKKQFMNAVIILLIITEASWMCSKALLILNEEWWAPILPCVNWQYTQGHGSGFSPLNNAPWRHTEVLSLWYSTVASLSAMLYTKIPLYAGFQILQNADEDNWKNQTWFDVKSRSPTLGKYSRQQNAIWGNRQKGNLRGISGNKFASVLLEPLAQHLPPITQLAKCFQQEHIILVDKLSSFI